MSDQNLTDFYFVYEDYRRALISNSVLTILGAVVGIIGNIVIIISYIVKWRGNDERYYIPYLATVDCMACVSGGFLYVLSNTYWMHFPSDILCRLLYFMHVFISAVSGHIILAISVQRYLLICKPYGPHLTLFWKRTSLFIITIVAIIYSFPVLFIAGNAVTKEKYHGKSVVYMECYFVANNIPEHATYTYILLVITLANIVAVISVYSPFIRKYRRVISIKNTESRRITVSTIELEHPQPTSLTTYSESRPTTSGHVEHPCGDDQDRICHNNKRTHHFGSHADIVLASNNRKRRMVTRMSLMFSVIISCYMFSYFPSLVLLILRYTLSKFRYFDFTEVQFFFWMLVGRFVFINHFINPFIYGYFDAELRKAIKEKTKKIFIRKTTH